MFESLVATLLNRFLGSYIENFDPKQLNIGIWSGDVKLKNLRLKKESLDKFELPVDVKFGHVGELTLQIPWSNLKSTPVKVIIEDIFLLASPIIIDEYDPEEDKRRQLEQKKQRLSDLEAIERATAQNLAITSDMNKNETFTENLITKIVDNLQVTIKNIHIRYEDDSVLTESPYSVGLTLDELSAVSADNSWTPSFISITQALTHKLLTLKSLSCYMNTESTTIYTDDAEELLENFRKSIFKDESSNVSDLQFLLKPVSGKGRLSVHKPGATEKFPHVKGELFFEEFGLELDSQQYCDILWTASKFHWYMKTHKFRKLRPKTTPEEDPKGWFKYAAESILNEIHEKNYKWSWAYFEKRRDQRRAYIELWKLHLTGTIFSEDQEEEFNKLEEDLPFEDIKFYRSLAKSVVRRENLEKPQAIAASSDGNNPQAKSGWISSWWSGSSTETKSNDEKDEDLLLSEDQKKALYDAIDYDETKELSEAVDLPRDRVKVELLASLKKGGISIRHKKGGPNLGEIVFEGCTAQLYQRPDSFLANFQLQEFRVEDGTQTTLYKHIVSVKQSHSHLHEVTGDNNVSTNHNDPFFKISFENNPLDGSADSVLLGKLSSMTIFYNPHFIEEITRFFTPPKIHLDTIGAIMNAAEATMEGITTQTRLGLQYALEEHKTINVKLDLQAPLIFLPLDPKDWKSPVAILDAGHISVVSVLADKKEIEEIKSKESYTSADWEHLNTLMYDQFNVHLEDAQFLIGPDIKSTTEQLHTDDPNRPALILDKLNIKLSMGVSIIPEAYNIPRFKIGGEVPSIRLSLNDFQYKTIMSLIDVVIPDFENLDSDDSSIFNTYETSNHAEIEELDSDTSSMEAKPDKSSPEDEQHLFEFDFKVDLVHLSLLRCIDGVTLETEPLVDLVGDSLALFFFKTTPDLKLRLTLDDINLIDNIEKSGIPEFEKLISSNNFVDIDEKDSKKEIFKVNYTRSLRLVELNNKQIEVFDQDIELNIATVKFVISRKSVLSILNFVLNTFVDEDAPETPADQLNHNDVNDAEFSPRKINVKIYLDSIILVLNEDGLKLATLQLSTADIFLLVLPEAMEIRGKLGALSLHDEVNHGSPRDSILRNLVSIDGNDLAEFTYKTFDVQTNTKEYNSQFEFKSGSARVNFVEDAFSKIINYASHFQRMKAVYDKAREAAISQASNIDDANKIRFDILIKAPTIVYPRLAANSNDTYDQLTAHLGEIYASNTFEHGDGGVHNLIEAGIRNIRILSDFHYGEVEQKAVLMEDLDVMFNINYLEEYQENRPTIIVDGKMPEIDLNLTELQLKYFLEFSDSITRVLDTSESQESLRDVEIDAANANAVAMHKSRVENPEPASPVVFRERQPSTIPSDHKQLKLEFKVPRVSLMIYNNTSGVASIDDKKLSSFSLNGFGISFEMQEDSHFISEIDMESFVVKDVREGSSNKFTDIVPLLKQDKNQFSLSASSDGPSDNKNITLMLSVDNPRMILALDYFFELQTFAEAGLASDPRMNELEFSNDANELASSSSSEVAAQKNVDTSDPLTIGFSVNISNPSVILLADSSKKDTDAVVFKIEQVLLTSQNILSLAANNIGMFLCGMDDMDARKLRIIDDFSISFAHDSRGSTDTSFLTNIQASVDSLLLRLSLRDIRLALGIFNNASELYANAQAKSSVIPKETDYSYSEDFKKKLSQYAPTILSNFSTKSNAKEVQEQKEVIIKGEELNASFGGMRFVLIGDVHELPVLDMTIKPFDIKAINWSTDLSAEVHIEPFVNIYNYARSSWEPLVEPWPIAVYASKVTTPILGIMVDVVSRKLTEITVSSRSIALLSQVLSSITQEDEIKERGEDYPYRIVNQTGFDVKVWTNSKDGTREKESVIKNMAEIPWEFEDWRAVRENLDTDKKQELGLELLNSNYNELSGLSATGEGEELFILYPPVDAGFHNRLSFNVTLGEDNVKTISLTSTITIQNDAENDVSIKVWLTEQKQDVTLIIKSQESQSLPIDLVYSGSLKFKPHMESSYKWSEETLKWKDLLKGGVPVQCSANDNKSLYYYQVEAVYDIEEPLALIYPHMKIVISAPVEIENLLPFDLNYRLYDKSTKRDWSGSIAKGVNSYVHVASLSSLLLLSVEPLDCGFLKSEFAIINSPKNSEFKREITFNTRHSNGQRLGLKVHYAKKKSSNSSLKVQIYSPYVILNRTGQNIIVSEKGNMLKSTSSTRADSISAPDMFSFDRDDDRKSRALLKVSDSAWTVPLSFDAIGQTIAAKAQLNGRQAEMNVGITVNEGDGKYKLSKVVTIAPRYVLRNTLDDDIQIIENGSTKSITVKSKEVQPLYGLRRIDQKSLLLKFNNSNKPWSSPFAIDDVGQVFLKVYKESVGQVLLKVNTIMENATIFIQVENANNNWPFSIRNFSDSEFYVYQGDPNVNENGDVVKHDTPYKPVFYKIPPKSVMPYAYDYPNAVMKELIIRSHERERSVNLAEIGNLRPFRLPASQNDEQAIVDLNVVADGPTQSLIISNYDPSVSLYKLKDNSSSSTSNLGSGKFEVNEKDESYHTKIITKFEGFGISLINTRAQELCYITLRGLEIRYNESDLYQNLSVKLKWVQIDNQLYGGIFPIVLYPSVIPKSGKEMNNHPSFSASICKVKDDSHGVLFIKYATVLLQEMTIEIDEDFLFALIDFTKVPGATWNRVQQDSLCDGNLEIPEPKLLNESSDIYFEALHLQPTLTHLSFVRTERVNAEDKTSSQNTLTFFFNVLTMAIGNINDAPIKLNALFIENIRVPIPILLESIQTHYGQAFFYQVHKILGSADFLGNPVGLFNNISSGVLDIFYEPYQGFIINDRPQELGIGIAKGGLSFLKKSIFGFSDSFAKVTGSLAKGLSVVTLDKKFQERRRLSQRRNKPKHALYGFASGANSFFESISSGVTGIATAPIEGATEGGATGFFKGLGKGVVGLPTKTAIGIFDLASNVSEGIRNTTTVFDAEGLDKVRLPRFVAHDHIIRPYSVREAQGQFWLNSIDGGEYFNETYLAHLILPGEEKAILISFRKIFLFNINTLKSIWVTSFDDVKSISIESTGIVIGLKGKREGPFIPIPDKSSRSFVYGRIGVAVQEFNKHCQVEL